MTTPRIILLAILLLTLASLHFTGALAQMAFFSGLLMGNAGPLAFAYVFWAQENR